MTKFAQGRLDLHSGRSQVDFDWLAARLEETGGDEALCSQARNANTALEVLQTANKQDIDIADKIARLALKTAQKTLRDARVCVDIVIVDRQGEVIARAE